MNRCDLVVHVDEMLEHGQQESLKGSLQNLPGVTSAHFSQKHPHLMTIAYDCERMEVGSILDSIAARGWHAQAVGM